VADNNVKAVVLDLFDTLVTWEPASLPLIEWQGREVRSTLPWLFPKLEELFGADFDRAAFLEVHRAVLGEIGSERERDGIEITCHERFVRALSRLGLEPPKRLEAAAEALVRIHMGGVRSVTSASPRRVDAVKRLALRYRLGLVSNFDDARTGHEILGDTGVAALFEAVIISAEAGIRKPNPLIFRRALEAFRLEPQEVLFVGDTPHDDIAGPRAVGMRTAWIDNGRAPLPEGIPAPDLVIKDLAELPARLGC
jgi:putative hydrolase of the HAD superfamily